VKSYITTRAIFSPTRKEETESAPLTEGETGAILISQGNTYMISGVSEMARQKAATATDAVVEYLTNGISSGQWKPGDKLPSEAQLCALLGASRITVRSAIGRLAGLGLVRSQQGRGTFVCTPSVMPAAVPLLPIQNADRLSVFEFRKIIESESAALAAIRASSADVQAMEETIVHMERGSDDRSIADQDLAFHSLIAQASGNEVIYRVFQMMQETYNRMFEDNVVHVGNAGSEHHRRILLAIQTRDMEAARRSMLAHLDDTMRSICKG